QFDGWIFITFFFLQHIIKISCLQKCKCPASHPPFFVTGGIFSYDHYLPPNRAMMFMLESSFILLTVDEDCLYRDTHPLHLYGINNQRRKHKLFTFISWIILFGTKNNTLFPDPWVLMKHPILIAIFK